MNEEGHVPTDVLNAIDYSKFEFDTPEEARKAKQTVSSRNVSTYWVYREREMVDNFYNEDFCNHERFYMEDQKEDFSAALSRYKLLLGVL